MRLLIGYDGSRSAENALEDLRFAGLADNVETIVLSVAETWLPKGVRAEAGGNNSAFPNTGDYEVTTAASAGSGEGEAVTLSSHAKRKLALMFPAWSVESRVRTGSPALEILTEAEKFSADLVVLGAHGMTSLGRLLLGSISQKVLSEAKCSVRVGRPGIRNGSEPTKLIIGFDGSPGSNSAVDAVAKRDWDGECRIFLVTATGTLAPTAIGRFIPPVASWIEEERKSERRWVEGLAKNAVRTLEGAGCSVELIVHSGNPKQVLVKEAEEIGAGCIFLGAHSYDSKLERFLIGSTSSAVAARAGCSVEVIRSD